MFEYTGIACNISSSPRWEHPRQQTNPSTSITFIHCRSFDSKSSLHARLVATITTTPLLLHAIRIRVPFDHILRYPFLLHHYDNAVLPHHPCRLHWRCVSAPRRLLAPIISTPIRKLTTHALAASQTRTTAAHATMATATIGASLAHPATFTRQTDLL